MDAASTALIASVTFRLAVLKEDNSTYIPNANAAYDFVHSNIDGGGWLRNTVDPLTFDTPSKPNETSPEGQSFVLLLESARRDFQDWVGSRVANAGHKRQSPGLGLSAFFILFCFFSSGIVG